MHLITILSVLHLSRVFVFEQSSNSSHFVIPLLCDLCTSSYHQDPDCERPSQPCIDLLHRVERSNDSASPGARLSTHDGRSGKSWKTFRASRVGSTETGLKILEKRCGLWTKVNRFVGVESVVFSRSWPKRRLSIWPRSYYTCMSTLV